MRKFIIAIICVFGVAGAYATGENERVTSMGYVNEELDTRQDKFDKLGANTAMTYSGSNNGEIGSRAITGDLGAESNTSNTAIPTVGAVDTKLENKQDELDFPANTVLVNTGTAGEPATKGIYDDSGLYATQQDALIDAATFNAALQTAINSELSCAQRKDPNDPTSKCLLFNIFAPTTYNASKNLFDESTAKIYRSVAMYVSGNQIGRFTPDGSKLYGVTYAIAVKPNTTYTLSKKGGNRMTIGCFKTPTVPGENDIYPDYTIRGVEDVLGNASYTFTTPSDCVWIVFGLRNNVTNYPVPTDIMLEYGATATEYEPYQNQNLYIPQNMQ